MTNRDDWRDWCPHIEACASLDECRAPHSRSEAAWQRKLDEQTAFAGELAAKLKQADFTKTKARLDTLIATLFRAQEDTRVLRAHLEEWRHSLVRDGLAK